MPELRQLSPTLEGPLSHTLEAPVRHTLEAPLRHTLEAPLSQTLEGPGDALLTEPIRVVLADDHAAARRSMRLLLESEDDVDVVAEASDLPTAISHGHWRRPHALVLDLQMPGGSSLEVIRRLRARLPDVPIVVLTMEESPAFARAAITVGAVGCVLKHRADTELPAAVRMATRGSRYISPRLAERFVATPADHDGDHAEHPRIAVP